MNPGDTSHSIGWYVGWGFGIFAFILFALFVLSLLAWWADRDRPLDRMPGGFVAVLFLLFLITAISVGLAMYPYDSEYHQWEVTEGTVEKIDSRLKSNGGDGMEERYVVRLSGVDGERACDDTRCATVEVGDVLTLTCKREWQYAGVDGYACNFIERKSQ